jgi:co-chaperonin GroES (HSP10)
MKTLNNNIIIKPLKEDEGKIIVTDKKTPNVGIVQTKGKLVKKGDKIAYKPWTETKIDDLIVIDEKEVLFIYD